MILAVPDPPESRASWCSKKLLSASTSGRDLAWRATRRSSALVPPHILLDDVDLRNARHGFSGDRRIAALGDLKEFTPQVAPAKGDCDPLRRQLLVRGIAIALHDAAIVCEQLLEMLAASPRRVGIGDSRRVGSA